MFDKTNAADLLALKNEVNNDPISMGFAAVDGQTQKTLGLLNDPDNNIGGETVNVELTAEVLLDVIDPVDFASNQVDQGERDWIKMLFDYAARGGQIEKYRAKLKAVFQANSQTITNIDALLRPLSRAEVLFGPNTSISRLRFGMAQKGKANDTRFRYKMAIRAVRQLDAMH